MRSPERVTWTLPAVAGRLRCAVPCRPRRAYRPARAPRREGLVGGFGVGGNAARTAARKIERASCSIDTPCAAARSRSLCFRCVVEIANVIEPIVLPWLCDLSRMQHAFNDSDGWQKGESAFCQPRRQAYPYQRQRDRR